MGRSHLLVDHAVCEVKLGLIEWVELRPRLSSRRWARGQAAERYSIQWQGET